MKELIESLIRYRDHKIETGSFLRACLENDLCGAFVKADHINKNSIGEIVQYLCNEMPSNMWGSKEKVNQHLN